MDNRTLNNRSNVNIKCIKFKIHKNEKKENTTKVIKNKE